MQRVVVANPGGQSHLITAAAAFAAAGELERYISPAGFGAADIERIRNLLPRPIGERLGSQLVRRSVPPEVAIKGVRLGAALDAANVLLMRSPFSSRVRFAGFRAARTTFDRRASRRLGRTANVVLGYQGAATAMFRRARELGIATVLDYPIAHYRVAEELLAEEARLVPEYAPTLQAHRYPQWLRHRYDAEIAMADRIIMVSERHRQTFVEAGIEPARTFIAPMYVDSELFTPAQTDPDGPFRVAFCGQITQRKGISYLIEAFRRAGLDDSELLLIGRPVGTSQPWINEPGVRHVPPMSRFLLPETLRSCHVVVLPSLVEGFPATVLMGMACGLPAIVSENIGRDVVEDDVEGWVVPIRDPDAIADRLGILHRDRERRQRMGAAARVKACAYTPERYGDALRDGIGALLKERTDSTMTTPHGE